MWSAFFVVVGLSTIVLSVEIMRLNDIVRTVREGLSQSSDTIVSEYLDNTFSAKRDAFDGSYKFSIDDFNIDVDDLDIDNIIKQNIGLDNISNGYGYVVEDKVEYFLNNLTMDIDNLDIHNNPEDIFTVTTKGDLNMHFKTLGRDLLPFTIPIEVKSKFTPLY